MLVFTKNLLLLLLIPSLTVPAFGHTVDSVGEYRLEIGWMNEPVVSGETNGIELFVSNLDPELDLEDQSFIEGIGGLQRSLKVQLVYQDHKIMLPLTADHNIPGKYYAFVNPTVSGYYQANILGNIDKTNVSLSMHPPKVEERSYIEFPEPSDLTLTQLIDGHTTLLGDVNNIKESIAKLENKNQESDIGYVGAVSGIIGIAIAITALTKARKN